MVYAAASVNVPADMRRLISTCVHLTHRNRHCTILLYDANNLYGWRCANLCHTSNFEDAANFDVNMIAPDSLIDYILEVDLKYLHD